MEIAVIGTGFIGGILGRALARSGHSVTFGSRRLDDRVAEGTAARVAPVGEAIEGAEVVIVAVPGTAVADFAGEHAAALAGKIVVDATNKMDGPVANSRAAFPASVRYVRAFNTVGGEVMADPVFPDGVANMFFAAPAAERATAEALIEGVGLRPVYLGEDREALADALFHLWITLAMEQGKGRRFALRLLEP